MINSIDGHDFLLRAAAHPIRPWFYSLSHNAKFERDLLRDHVKAGIAQARKEGRPLTVAKYVAQIRSLAR
jgi:hypothetical protein